MSEEEIITEWEHRQKEREGHLAGPNKPTPEERAIAIAEADEWERQYRASLR